MNPTITISDTGGLSEVIQNVNPNVKAAAIGGFAGFGLALLLSPKNKIGLAGLGALVGVLFKDKLPNPF